MCMILPYYCSTGVFFVELLLVHLGHQMSFGTPCVTKPTTSPKQRSQVQGVVWALWTFSSPISTFLLPCVDKRGVEPKVLCYILSFLYGELKISYFLLLGSDYSLA